MTERGFGRSLPLFLPSPCGSLAPTSNPSPHRISDNSRQVD